MPHDYDQLPYVSMPIAYSEPRRLAAMAVLHGISTPDVARADVLEIGCASGGNLIPLAVRFPAARFLGVDLAAEHVRIGQRRIAALGLGNIEFRHADIAAFDPGSRRFDYIICHGVFSWVPEAVRLAILRLVRSALTPSGIAAISFNVLPGWHIRAAIRDICLTHSKSTDTPRRRVAQVREVLALLSQTARDGDPYGVTLRTEAARLARRPASYILGELLCPDNHAMHVRDFCDLAGRHDLAYLCEGNLASCTPEAILPDAAQTIRRLAGSDPIAVQHYLDMFTGRTFRQSILTRSGQASARWPAPDPAAVAHLHWSSRLVPAGDGASPAALFKDGRGRNVVCHDRALRPALAALGARYPSTATLSELTDTLEGTPADRDVALQHLRAFLLELATSGRATASTTPLRSGRPHLSQARLWRVARDELATGQPWLTSLQHTSVLMNPTLAFLARQLADSADADEIVARLAQAITSGRLSPQARGPEPDHPSVATAQASDIFEQAMQYFALNALLEPIADSSTVP